MRLGVACLVAMAALVGLGCGGDSGNDSLTVSVQSSLGEPVVGATVVVETRRTRKDGTTDATGLARVSGFALDDLVSVVAFADGYYFMSASGVFVVAALASGATTLDLTLGPVEAPASYVTLSGSVAGMSDPAAFLVVDTSTRSQSLLNNHLFPTSEHHDTGPAWTLRVPPSTLFTIFAYEFQPQAPPPGGSAGLIPAWVRLENPGVTADGTLAIDFASPTPPTLVSGTFAKPADAILAGSGEGRIWVKSLDSGDGARIGRHTLMEPSTDGSSFDYDAEYVDAPGHTLVTQYIVEAPTRFAHATIDGPPVAGPVDPAFLLPPDVTAASLVSALIVWEYGGSLTLDRQLVAVSGSAGYLGVHLVSPAETATLLAPVPELYPDPTTAMVLSCADVRDGVWCDRMSGSVVTLTP